jgi:ATP-binding cassette subfamily B protein
MVEMMGDTFREQMPEHLEGAVRDLLDEGEEPRITLSADLDRNARFGATSWLVATDRRLLILSPMGKASSLASAGEARKPKRRRRRPSRGGALDVPLLPPPYHLTHVPLAKAVEVKARETVGGGVLQVGFQAVEEGTPPVRVDLLRFSRTHLVRIGDAAQLIEKMRQELAGVEQAAAIGIRRKRSRARCERCGRVLPPGSDTCPACVNKGKVLIRLLGYLGPYWKLSLLSLLASIGLTALALTPPYLMRLLIDEVLTPRKNAHLLFVITGILAAVHLVRLAVGAGRDWLNSWLGQRVYFDLRTQIYRHVQRLSLGFYDRKQVGGVLSRITSDAGTLHYFLVGSAQNLLIHTLTVVGIAVMLFAMNWRLALIVLMPTPLLIVGTFWFGRRVRVVYRRYWRLISSINSLLVSTISGARVVKSFGQESREVGRFEDRSDEFRNTSLAAARLSVIYYPSMALITVVSSILIWLVGGQQVLKGTLSLGMLTAFTSYMWQFYAPISVLCEINNVLQQTATAAERVFEVLDTEPDVPESANAITLERIEGHIEFRDVCFSYDEAEALEPLLKQINLVVQPGEMIGLVGASGSGKTTLVNLLLRFYDPTSGQVLIDGHDLRDVKLRCLREQMAVVLQEPYLFKGTIAENIAYGRPDATRDQIIEAARAANAHNFIIKFPDGYDTEVGERGGRLSGGERQRVSIARALLNNPRILILDEATASVDTETEKQIQEALEQLMKGRTCFAIAHRLSTLRMATRLVVLDGGRIAEIGTHEELIAKEDGIYAKLVKIQTEMAKSIAPPAETAREEHSDGR